MSQKKLKELGLKLPVLPTTTVGSFPKPDYLKKARTQFVRGEIGRERLFELERKATDFWIKDQQEAGLDILVDGEMYRGDMVAYFAENFGGFEKGGLVRSYGNRYYYKPITTGEVRWRGPITVDWWKYSQGLTPQPVKGMLTGAYTIMDWSFNEFYPSRRDATLAIARELRKEVEALIAAGVKIIQIDEPASSVRIDEFPLMIEAMQKTTEGLKAYFITHMCYGTFERIYPDMLKVAVDNIDLETSNSELDLLDVWKEHPFTKDLSLGVYDVHSHHIPPEAVMAERIDKALKVIPLQQLWIDPDCGLKTREVEQAQEQLRAMVRVVQAKRKQLSVAKTP